MLVFEQIFGFENEIFFTCGDLSAVFSVSNL